VKCLLRCWCRLRRSHSCTSHYCARGIAMQ